MRLPMNITGISNREIKMEQMDGRLFQRLSYEIARKVKGKVIGWYPPGYPLNYFRVDMEKGKNIVSILLHEYYPYVATAAYKNELQIGFLDLEDIFEVLRPYYIVLETSFLNEPFDPNAHDLTQIEIVNAKYWRPKTNGEVIFNCWD